MSGLSRGMEAVFSAWQLPLSWYCTNFHRRLLAGANTICLFLMSTIGFAVLFSSPKVSCICRTSRAINDVLLHYFCDDE